MLQPESGTAGRELTQKKKVAEAEAEALLTTARVCWAARS
eukprot:COSAG02_NODE_64601_length_260_cov_0.639752_1_plen_39_part_01